MEMNSLYTIWSVASEMEWKTIFRFLASLNSPTFKASLDSEMQSKGAGSPKRQAEILTEEEGDHLWKEGLLGDGSPQSLLNSMVFYNGLYFALQIGKEHRQLRSRTCQITLVENPGEKAYFKEQARRT